MQKGTRTVHILVPDFGATGFEPMTSCTPCKRATGLRHAPYVALQYSPHSVDWQD